MVAINQGKTYKSYASQSPDIFLDSNLKRWFSRNLGLWKSNRSYYLEKEKRSYNICMFINIEALENPNKWESHYKFTWYPEKKYQFFKDNPEYTEAGEMKAYIQGHQLIREEFYLSNKSGISNIKQVDEHEIIFDSSYENWHILEHTRLVDMDNFRYRVIYSWNRNNLQIVENHHEIKIV